MHAGGWLATGSEVVCCENLVLQENLGKQLAFELCAGRPDDVNLEVYVGA